MNKKLLIAAGALAFALTGCDQMCQGPKTKTALVTDKDKYSYALGAHFGNQARFQLVTRDSIDLDLDLFIQAFKERYNEDSAHFLMNDSTIFQTLTDLSQARQAEKAKKDSLAAEANKAAGEAFLAKNKTAEGVVTTESVQGDYRRYGCNSGRWRHREGSLHRYAPRRLQVRQLCRPWRTA